MNKHKNRKNLTAKTKKKGKGPTGKDLYHEEHKYDSNEYMYCEPLIMSMDADSQFGQLWILGMPFFRKYYTTFHFLQREGRLPEAAKMSFSEQNGDCEPGNAPQPIEEKMNGKKKTASSSDSQIFNGQR